MASSGGGDQLLEGIRALEGADWSGARAALSSVLETGDVPDARDGLGLALWFLGEIAEGIAERERAFDGFVRAGRCDDAARVAVWVSHQHLLVGRVSAARGWLARAERALEGTGSCRGRGWVAVERARHAPTAHEQIERAGHALAIAREFGDGDLEVFAVSLLGRATVGAGRREDGLALLEEAMAAASAGRVRNVHTLAEAYCNLVEGCAAAGDLERSSEWCAIVEDFARSHDTAPLLGACRTIHADVLMAAGRWPEAEQALTSALATHARYVPQMSAPAVAALAELRVQQGRLADAQRLLAGREEHPASLRALALLRVAEGRAAEASALLERGLRATEDHAVRASQLLGPLVDARLAAGDADGAAVAAGDLSALARETEIRLIGARADLAAAKVALQAEGAPEAAELARRALAAFAALAMPFDAAEARLTLARALAADAPALARDEARTAFETFRGLGAARAMDAAAGVLRQVGGATGPRVRVAGELTAREREVLELLALGMSNARIAATLVISEKTAGHHVSRILMKLGVHTRGEAVAHAAREAAATTATAAARDR